MSLSHVKYCDADGLAWEQEVEGQRNQVGNIAVDGIQWWLRSWVLMVSARVQGGQLGLGM